MTARLAPAAFERKAFSVSRLAEFASIDELTKQTGQPVKNWPLVVAKETVDNAADEAEEAGVAPVVEVVVTDNSIAVTDHGRGIKPAVVKALIDYSTKTSSRAAVVAPTRGQHGNALQSIIPMGFVLAREMGGDPASAAVLIESCGVAHDIRFTVDPVRQTPVVSRVVTPSAVKNGTRVTVRWPEQACFLIADVSAA